MNPPSTIDIDCPVCGVVVTLPVTMATNSKGAVVEFTVDATLIKTHVRDVHVSPEDAPSAPQPERSQL